MAMHYTTELIEKVLTNEKAKEILGWLPPVYHEAYVFLSILNTVGEEISEMDEWVESYRDQVVPQTATWSLPYWEERYGLVANTNMTLEQRRAAVITKMVTRAPINPRKLEQIIEGITGLSVEIHENTGKNRFEVTCEGIIPKNKQNLVRNEINTLKPAYLIYSLRSRHYLWLSQAVEIKASAGFTTGIKTDEFYENHMRYVAQCTAMPTMAIDMGIQCLAAITADTEAAPSVSSAATVGNRIQAEPQGISSCAKVPVKTDYASGIRVRINPWYLNGEHSLDGELCLNAEDYFINL